MQTFTVTQQPTAGTYTLTHGANTPGAITYDNTAADATRVQTALRLLTGLSQVTVTQSDDTTATYADRLIAFSSDGERADAFHATAAPTPTSAAMEFSRGQSIRNDQPSAGGDPGWVCTTTGRPATFKALGNLDA